MPPRRRCKGRVSPYYATFSRSTLPGLPRARMNTGKAAAERTLLAAIDKLAGYYGCHHGPLQFPAVKGRVPALGTAFRGPVSPLQVGIKDGNIRRSADLEMSDGL